jgi:hypothetical protein
MITDVLLCFYSSKEIRETKRLLVAEFSSQLSTPASVAEQRNSPIRAAHEAEIGYILRMFDILDWQEVIVNSKIIALSLENQPRHSPEEMKLASVVQWPLHTEASVRHTAAAYDRIVASRVSINCSSDVAVTSHLVAFRLVAESKQQAQTFSSSSVWP